MTWHGLTCEIHYLSILENFHNSNENVSLFLSVCFNEQVEEEKKIVIALK